MADIQHFPVAEKTDFPTTWRGEIRALLKLGLPMAITQLIQYLIFTIDIVMLGRVSAHAVAASGLGNAIYFMFFSFGLGPVTAVSPLVSQALGWNKHERQDVRRSVRMGIWVVLSMTPIVFIALAFATPFAKAMGQDTGVAIDAGRYVLTILITWPSALIIIIFRNFLAALGQTLIPLIFVIMIAFLNVFFNYVFIFGNFGMPRLEVVGAGIASSLSYSIALIGFILYLIFNRQTREFTIFARFWRPDWARYKEVIRLGIPIGFTSAFEGMLFNATLFLMGILSVAHLAAYELSINVAALIFMIPFGLSMAGAVRIGLAKGAGNYAAMRRVAGATVGICALISGLAAIPLLLAPELIAHLYLDKEIEGNAQALGLTIVFLKFVSAFLLFDAIQVSTNQLLRGLKDVTWPMILTGISYWIIGFPLAVILAFYLSFGATGIWVGLIISLFCVALSLGTRLFILIRRR